MIKIIEFKVRYRQEKRNWECLRIAQTLNIDNDNPAYIALINETARGLLRHTLNAVEVRWNEKDSYQGHYVRR